jgi:formylglycine-generating enzyme required for sulfatase activity
MSDDSGVSLRLGNGVVMDFVLIPPGTFTMGTEENSNEVPANEPLYLGECRVTREIWEIVMDSRRSEEPAHKVTITKPFFLGTYPVTQEQWEIVMGSNPSRFNGPKNPVEMVRWDDCQAFCAKLAAAYGGSFRLPTEAQWEYACRAGSTGEYCFGDDESQLREYAWYDHSSGGVTHPVGEKRPNAWGLYDMHGNVWEWCQDLCGPYGSPPTDDPTGPVSGSDRVHRGRCWITPTCNHRVLRGGCWIAPTFNCRSATRGDSPPRHRGYIPGFRVSRVQAE